MNAPLVTASRDALAFALHDLECSERCDPMVMGKHYHQADRLLASGVVRAADVRPLVVLDPEDREQVERLVVAHCRAYCCDPAPLQPEEVAIMQAALREFANPKPVEPMGRYAAVIDANGNEWVRLGEGPAPWMHNGSPDNRDTLPWSKLDAVRVLSEGVTQ